MTDELGVGWGKWQLRARGVVVAMVVTAVIAVGVSWYVDSIRYEAIAQKQDERHGQSVRQHNEIAREIRVQTCIQSLTAQERQQMRDTAGRRGVLSDLLPLWCPWLDGGLAERGSP